MWSDLSSSSSPYGEHIDLTASPHTALEGEVGLNLVPRVPRS